MPANACRRLQCLPTLLMRANARQSHRTPHTLTPSSLFAGLNLKKCAKALAGRCVWLRRPQRVASRLLCCPVTHTPFFFAPCSFAASASVSGDDEIIVQGDVTDDIEDFMTDKWPDVSGCCACFFFSFRPVVFNPPLSLTLHLHRSFFARLRWTTLRLSSRRKSN